MSEKNNKGVLCNWSFDPLMSNVSYHVKTSQLICSANQLTGIYMMGHIAC